MPQLPAIRMPTTTALARRQVNAGAIVRSPAKAIRPNSPSPGRPSARGFAASAGACRPGIGKHGKKCKHGVRADGFCCDAPPKVDTLVIKDIRPQDGYPSTVRSATTSAVSSAVGGAAGAAAAGAVKGSAARAALQAGASAVGSYLTGKALVKGATAGVKFVAKRTPAGRAAMVGYTAYKAAKAVQRGTSVGPIIRGLLKP